VLTNWLVRAALYTIATTSAGALVGAALGAGGALIPMRLRIASATFLALVAVVVAMCDLADHAVPLLQCSRETPQVWVWSGAVRWTVLNGGSLGCGAFTRIGFWAWYAIPFASLLLGDPLIGALVYGAYGLARSIGGLVVLCAMWFGRARRLFDADEAAMWLLMRQPVARRLAAVELLAVGIIVVALVGL